MCVSVMGTGGHLASCALSICVCVQECEFLEGRLCVCVQRDGFV